MQIRNARVAVIGGGYAGLSAASELASNGIETVVFEASPTLGGRARGITFKNAGLDNGAHIFSGAYKETLRIMQLVGASINSFLRIPLQIEIKDHFHLKATPLPTPFNLIGAIVFARGLSISERWQFLRFMLAMHRCSFRLLEDTFFTDLLNQFDQSMGLQKYFWEPICVAALNTLPKDASAQIFLNVLRDGVVNGNNHDSDFLLPRVDLSCVFPNQAAKFIEEKKGMVKLLSPVDNIAVLDDGAIVISSKNKLERFDALILAIGPHQTDKLLKNLPEMKFFRDQIERFTYEPICTVYLKYDVDIMLPSLMLGLDSNLIHWIFDRQISHNQKGLIAAVTSANGNHLELTKEDLVSKVTAEISRHFSHLKNPLWAKVITEKFATFSCTPNLKRPGNVTPIKNFFIAGDYTDSEYPATIESAVRSGVKCAHLLMAEAS